MSRLYVKRPTHARVSRMHTCVSPLMAAQKKDQNLLCDYGIKEGRTV